MENLYVCRVDERFVTDQKLTSKALFPKFKQNLKFALFILNSIVRLSIGIKSNYKSNKLVKMNFILNYSGLIQDSVAIRYSFLIGRAIFLPSVTIYTCKT